MLSSKEYKKLLLDLLLIRTLEEKIILEYQKKKIRCPVHLSIGQEASSVGICNNLLKNDQIVLSHRCHASYIAKGGSIKKMISEMYGKSNGCSGGKSGSMHLFDKENGILASVPIVASGIPLAVGAALYFKINKIKNISVAFYGDAAIEEGIFHESINFAAVKKLPILFVCENNNYSCYTGLNQRQPKNLIKKIGSSYNIKTKNLAGNNTIKIYSESKKIIKEIRNNGSPQILLINSFRKFEHCGTEIDDNLNYRNKNEIIKGNNNCPVKFLKNYYIKNNILKKKNINKIELAQKSYINNIFSNVEKYKNINMKKKMKEIYAK
jgi:TPP-dependent pyruvate/acetoin dehydrogenase alpha subunit